MEEGDKGCPMVRMGVSGWMFLLVPTYPGSPRQKAVKLLCGCRCVWEASKHCYLTWFAVAFEFSVSCGVVCTAAGCNENDYVHLWCQSYLTEQLKCGELRARLWIDDIITMVQWNRLKWYGHVLRKDDDYWVKKCMQCEVENVKPVGRSRKLPSEWGYKKDCQARQQCEADAVDCIRNGESQLKILCNDHKGRGWVNKCFFLVPAYVGCPGKGPLDGLLLQLCRVISSIDSNIDSTVY